MNHHHRFIVRFPIGLGFPLITFPFPVVLIKSIGKAFFYDRISFLTSTTCVECSVNSSGGERRGVVVVLIYLYIYILIVGIENNPL